MQEVGGILLIGGAGFIGSHLAIQLRKQGYDVAVLDSLEVNHIGQLVSDFNNPKRKMYLGFLNERIELLKDNNIKFYNVDARDYHSVSSVVNEFKPEVIIHLAAVAHANISNKNPYSTFDHSLRTLENALDASRGIVKQFIYFSSSMVYGTFQNEEVIESDALHPLGVYGCLKVSGELMTLAYKQVFNIPYTIIRPSALYGERCVSGRVVQQFIENAIEGKSLKVMGGGEDKLDFTYIDDLVQGVIAAIGNPKAYNQAFNITYGSSRSLMDLAKLVREGFDVEIEYVKRDKLIPKRGTLNISKARALLGYLPQYSIDDGVKKYINWYKERK